MDNLTADLARLQHDALTWKAEAERLNVIVHAQRRDLDRLRRESFAPLVRGLLRLTMAMTPFVERAPAGPYKDALLADVRTVCHLASTTLQQYGV